ncbi:MAG: hypothetical protein HQL82_10370 [Magnetococcales bacterium]|nr:hypothetical protein [Magnetococcales bacterium]
MFDRKIAWIKKGLILEPRTSLWWNRTHIMAPTIDPQPVSEGCFKVYFGGRNDRNQTHVGWAIIDLRADGRVVDWAEEPVLHPGRLGTFDDNGVVPNCLVNAGAKKYLYYVGFKPGGTTRMDLYGGLAISSDGGRTYERYSEAPILDRTHLNPYINTAPYVILDGGLWRMWYVAGTGWRHRDTPRYNLQHATSPDGIHWQRDGTVCIDFADDRENALARPFVLKEDGVYKMWFAHKGAGDEWGNYRLGYAESEDGINWIRRDDFVGIDVSPSGWDSEMMEYAVIARYNGRRFMIYNGNAYGTWGAGLAVEA